MSNFLFIQLPLFLFVFSPGCTTVLLPAKVVQALNLNFEAVNHGQAHPRFGTGFSPDHGKKARFSMELSSFGFSISVGFNFWGSFNCRGFGG